MRKTIPLLALSVMLGSAAAWAPSLAQADDQLSGESSEEKHSGQESGQIGDEAGQVQVDEQDQEPGIAGGDTVTIREEREVTRGILQRELVGIKPQIGTMLYTDVNNGTSARLALGTLVEMNAVRLFAKDDPNWSRFYIGPSTGFIYSHIGRLEGNFFGADTDDQFNAANPEGSNVVLVPLNLKAAWNATDDIRVGVHGGGNWFYRSVANSVRLSPDNSAGTQDEWTLYPNVGLDFEMNLFEAAALMVRPDMTFTPGDEAFTGTLALNIPLG